jgi:uncharacterized membrane protein (DUF2068 family)
MMWFFSRRWREARLLHRASNRVPFLVRLIAVGETLKGLLFLIAGLLTARIAHAPDLHELVASLLKHLHFDPDGGRAHRILAWSMGLSHERLELIAVGLFIYAAIYIIVGIGLWFDRLWAEWLVVLGTLIFIPFEIEHLFTKYSWVVAVVLLINIGITVFLANRIWQRRKDRKKATS